MSDSNKTYIDLKKFYTETIKQHAPYLTHQFQVRIIKDEDSWFSDPTNSKSDSNSLSFPFYVQSANVPQLTIADTSISFLSQDFVVPKVAQHGGTWNVSLLLTNDLKAYNMIYTWQQSYADLEYSGGSWPNASKAIPNHKAVVDLLDSTHQRSIATFVLHGVYPTGLPTIDFRYENNATTKTPSFNFVYQYMSDNLGNEAGASGLINADKAFSENYAALNQTKNLDGALG